MSGMGSVQTFRLPAPRTRPGKAASKSSPPAVAQLGASAAAGVYQDHPDEFRSESSIRRDQKGMSSQGAFWSLSGTSRSRPLCLS